MLCKSLFTFAAFVATSSATIYSGFNYGATFNDKSAKQESDFHAEFTTAMNLLGTNGEFTSARLYTMIQGGTSNTPISAIPAAISTNTSLLLGLWASAGQDVFSNELSALKSAISTYGSNFTDLVVGISVGSEDLYRISASGIKNKAGVGAGPDIITNYIDQLRSAISNTPLSNTPVGHVDSFSAWLNSSNNAVTNACDWIGMDAYPYFDYDLVNSIQNSQDAFFDSYYNTTKAVGGKPVWITETGWPVSGPNGNLAVANIQNAQTYWDQVACKVLGNVNTWWYMLQDAKPTAPSPSFGIVGANLGDTPLYNLSCSGFSNSLPDPASLTQVPAASSTSAGSTIVAKGSVIGLICTVLAVIVVL